MPLAKASRAPLCGWSVIWPRYWRQLLEVLLPGTLNQFPIADGTRDLLLRMLLTPRHSQLLNEWQIDPIVPGDGLGAMFGDWQALVERMHGAHPLLDAAYVDGLLRHFPAQNVVLASWLVGGQLRGMVLLQQLSKSAGLWRSYLPAQSQLGLALLPSETPLQSLYKALPGTTRQVDFLCNDPAFGDLRGINDPLRHAKPHALTMRVHLKGSFDNFWAARPHKLVSNMRRYERMAAEVGSLELRRISEPEAIEAAMQRYGELEASGWKGRQGTALMPGGEQFRFYSEQMVWAASHSQARIYELWAGGLLLASRMMLLSPNMVISLKTTFNEEYQRLAPGRLLLKAVLEDLFRAPPAPVIEFYTDANSDQLAWASEQRWIYHVESYASASAAGSLRLLRRLVPRRRQSRIPPQSDQRISIDQYAPPHLPQDVRRFMAEAGEQRHIELGADWFALLSRTVFATTPDVRVFVLRHARHPVAVLPTLRQGHELCALANYYSAYFEPVLAEGIGAQELLPLLQAVRRASRWAAQYRFWPMDPTHTTFHALHQGLRLAGLKPFPFFCFGNWYLRVQTPWADYLAARNGQIRSTLKRTAKRFAERGGRLTHVQDGPDLEKHLLAYEKVYAASWKEAEPYPEFVRGLVRLCAQRGWLRFGVAWLGEEPIAAQLWYVNAGSASIFKLAYDESHKAMAAGNLITAMLMEHVLDVDQVHEVDYLIGDDAYKQAWMSDRRERWGLVAFDPWHPLGLLRLARQSLVALAKRHLSAKLIRRLRDRREAGDTETA